MSIRGSRRGFCMQLQALWFHSTRRDGRKSLQRAAKEEPFHSSEDYRTA